MRISDWSSDVCSSDLRLAPAVAHLHPRRPGRHARHGQACHPPGMRLDETVDLLEGHVSLDDEAVAQCSVTRCAILRAAQASLKRRHVPRSEELRVGKECGSTCRYRLAPYLYKNKKNK